MKLKLINNNSGFDCGGCILAIEDGSCGLTEELQDKYGDCSVNAYFIEEVENEISK